MAPDSLFEEYAKEWGMKVTFEVDPFEDRDEYETLVMARDTRYAIRAVLDKTREMLKYRDLSEESQKIVEELRTIAFDGLDGFDP